MSETKSKPMTLKGALALIGAGAIALVAQCAGIDLKALTEGGKAGDSTEARTEVPAEEKQAKAPPQESPAPAPAPETNKRKKEEPKAEEPAKRDDTAEIRRLFRAMRSDVQVEAEGEVTLILRDDTRGDQHQLFLVELSNGITVKISHNIDIAPRVPIEKGDTIRFHGEYEYNSKGGVVHWTHRTLRNGRHPHGWLLHEGKKYH